MKNIPLTKGRVALVDDSDYPALSKFNWHSANGYAARRLHVSEDPLRRLVLMHHAITGWKSVDHEDGNGENNQRYNLRRATKKQNNMAFRRKTSGASSKYRGVCWDRSRNKWLASIERDGKQMFLGRFKGESEAARAYDAAAKQHFGEFASFNFK